MDVGALGSTLAASGVAGTIDTSVLKSVQNLDQTLVGELFGSIGLGSNVNTLA